MDTTLLSQAMLPTEPGDDLPKKKPVVDNSIRGEWNRYVSYLEKKGLKGNPVLDRGEKSYEALEQYRKDNPSTPLTREHITPIQEDFSKYKEYMLNQISKGKAAYGEGVNKENFMRALSTVDGIPGSRTTSFSFPSAYLSTFEDEKLLKKENKGFATTTTDVYAKQ